MAFIAYFKDPSGLPRAWGQSSEEKTIERVTSLFFFYKNPGASKETRDGLDTEFGKSFLDLAEAIDYSTNRLNEQIESLRKQIANKETMLRRVEAIKAKAEAK